MAADEAVEVVIAMDDAGESWGAARAAARASRAEMQMVVLNFMVTDAKSESECSYGRTSKGLEKYARC